MILSAMAFRRLLYHTLGASCAKRFAQPRLGGSALVVAHFHRRAAVTSSRRHLLARCDVRQSVPAQQFSSNADEMDARKDIDVSGDWDDTDHVFTEWCERKGRNYRNSYLVPTALRRCPETGLGVLTKEPLAKGTIVYREEDVRNIQYSFDEVRGILRGIPDHADRELFLAHSWASRSGSELGSYFFSTCDKVSFTNHSSDPTTVMVGPPGNTSTICITTRDVAAGEELTMDYTAAFDEPKEYEQLFVDFLGKEMWQPPGNGE